MKWKNSLDTGVKRNFWLHAVSALVNKSEIFEILIQSKNFIWIIRSDPIPMDLSKYLIQSDLYPKKLWLSSLLQWSVQFGYPYLIRLSFFQNPVQPGSGSELQNLVGSRSGNRIMYTCAEEYFTHNMRSENWWLGLRASCLRKCVGLWFGWGPEKEKKLRLKTKSKNFHRLNLFPVRACCGCLTSNQNVLIYARHIKKVLVKLYCFYAEKQNNWQTITG